MPIHIDQIQTDVQVDPAPPPAASAPPDPPGQALQRHRDMQAQMLCDEDRTRASGNED